MVDLDALSPLSSPFMVGPWLVEPAWRRLSRGSESCSVEPRVMQLLALLAAAPGRPVTRDRLLDAVWPDRYVNEDALSRAVSQLRRVLSDDPRDPRFIRTLHKGGYCLVAPVRLLDDKTSSRASLLDDRWRPWPVFAALIALLLLSGLVLVAPRRGAVHRAEAALVPVPLTSEPGREIDPAISPDGSRLAFGASTDAGYDLFWRRIGEGRAERLTHDGQFSGYPAWSPDGRLIAFISGDRAVAAIEIIAVADGARRRLLELPSWSGGLDWSPDGRLLACSVGEADQPRNILLIDLVSGERRTISRGTSSWGDRRPVFSPDGRRIAFLRDAGLGLDRILVADLADPERVRPAVDRPAEIRGFDWGATGRFIVYSAATRQGFRLWRAPLHGATAQPIASEGGEVFNPSLASNGAVVAEAVDRDIDIWRQDVSGAGAAPLLRSTFDDYEATYSPDGRSIAFVSERSGTPELWVADADGGNARQLTRFGGPRLGSTFWSPDGRRLAFHALEQGYAATFAIPAAGGQAVRIAGGGSVHYVPLGWSPRAAHLFFKTGSGSNWSAWQHDMTARQSRRLNAVPARLAAVSADGTAIYLVTDDGATLMRTVLASGEVRSVVVAPELRGAVAIQEAADGLYFLVPRNGGTALFRLRFNEGSFVRAGFVPSYGRIAVARDGRRLLYSNERETANDIVMLRLR